MANPSIEELKLNVEVARWEWLKPHLERGGLLFISPDLDLVEVGFCIASDDVATVSAWIARGEISKPSAEQVFDWEAIPDTAFRILIVSPYVLVQLLEEAAS